MFATSSMKECKACPTGKSTNGETGQPYCRVPGCPKGSYGPTGDQYNP